VNNDSIFYRKMCTEIDGYGTHVSEAKKPRGELHPLQGNLLNSKFQMFVSAITLSYDRI